MGIPWRNRRIGADHTIASETRTRPDAGWQAERLAPGFLRSLCLFPQRALSVQKLYIAECSEKITRSSQGTRVRFPWSSQH
jgi:hypothetical protein